MNTRFLTLALAAAVCGFTTSPAMGTAPKATGSAELPGVLADAEAKVDLKKFLYSTKGTYGWQPVKGTIMFDFFKDGRLAVQGPDGEATMWEGKWSLKDDKLTMSYDKKTMTVTAAIDGDDLLLDGKRYKRSKAE
jgi:hypothetical protein